MDMDTFEYLILALEAQGESVWAGVISRSGGETTVSLNGYQERVGALDRLGAEGWELVAQLGNHHEHDQTRAFVFGWEYTFRRRVATSG